VRAAAACVAAIGTVAAIQTATVATLSSVLRNVTQGEHQHHAQGRYRKRLFHDFLFSGEGGNCTTGEKKNSVTDSLSGR